MERMWSSEAKMKYPKQWILMVNIADEPTTNKTFGDVYLITPDREDAYAKAIALGDSMGGKLIVEGFDDTQRYIGGLEQGHQRHQTSLSCPCNISQMFQSNLATANCKDAGYTLHGVQNYEVCSAATF